MDTIQPGMAEPYLREAISFGQKSTKTSFHDMARLKRQFAENLVNLGKAKEAVHWVEKEKWIKPFFVKEISMHGFYYGLEI